MFDPAFDDNAGRLSTPGDRQSRDLRVRGKNVTEDLFSDFSSFCSSRQQSSNDVGNSSLASNTPPPPNPLPHSLLLGDLDLSDSSEEEGESGEKVKVQNVTSSSLVEGQMNASMMKDVSRMEEKMKSRKVRKIVKPVPYLPPDNVEEEEVEEGEVQQDRVENEMVEEGEVQQDQVENEMVEEEQNIPEQTREEQLAMCKKSGLNRGIMKTVFESYSMFRTPINFQLVDKKLVENGQWKVTLSDGIWKHTFMFSNKYERAMTRIPYNSILCINLMSKMKPKKSVPMQKLRTLLITNFFVPVMQQVGYQLIGSPKTLKL